MARWRGAHLFMGVLLLAAAAGCSSGDNVVSGTVTVNGEPLQNGHITFFPMAGTRNAQGTPITDGQFTLKKIPPGTWKAVVSQTPQVSVLKNGVDPPTIAFAPAAMMVWPETPGNQRIVEIRPGKQTLDIALSGNTQGLN